MQLIKIMIPLRPESNSNAENDLRIEYPQVEDEIAAYSQHGLCGAIQELITIAKRLADQEVRLQLVGSAPSSTLLYVAGLSGLCPEKNQFFFERFLETNTADGRQEDFVLTGYSMFGPNRILAVLEQLGFGIHETEKGLLVSKSDRMDGGNKLILLIRAKGLATNAFPTIEELANDRTIFERIATGDTEGLSMKGQSFASSEYTLDQIRKAKPNSLKKLSELLAHRETKDAPTFQEDQMTELSQFASVNIRDAFILIRDIAKHGINTSLTDLQAQFVDAADRNGKSKYDSMKLMGTIGPRVLPCKSHCYAQATEIMETIYIKEMEEK